MAALGSRQMVVVMPHPVAALQHRFSAEHQIWGWKNGGFLIHPFPLLSGATK